NAISDNFVDKLSLTEGSRHFRGVGRKELFYEDFKKYLSYKGRGIPRRIIRAFNEYVQWEDGKPLLAFSGHDMRRIRFYAGLQEIINNNSEKIFGDVDEEVVGTFHDKLRLGVYYIIDWMLRRGNREFTLNEAITASKNLSARIAPAEEVAL